MVFVEKPAEVRHHHLEVLDDVTCCFLEYVTQVTLAVAFYFILIQPKSLAV